MSRTKARAMKALWIIGGLIAVSAGPALMLIGGVDTGLVTIVGVMLGAIWGKPVAMAIEDINWQVSEAEKRSKP